MMDLKRRMHPVRNPRPLSEPVSEQIIGYWAPNEPPRDYGPPLFS